MVEGIAPGFLIAVPQLLDPNFRQSVVLLLRQDGEGALGIVVNRETSLLLRDLCRDHEIPYAGNPDKHVRLGGPVQPEQGFVLYGPEHGDPEGREVQSGLYFSTSTGTLSRLCSLASGRFHCYSGYSGWGPGQLERELAEGAWILSPSDPARVLDQPPADMWRGALASLGIDPAAIVPSGGES
ncbi:MAG: YqgE/AlgH family protein [Acidobacteriia bacterium]|nr:YqgE/AlgH family protein [Terriglobia bacterium]